MREPIILPHDGHRPSIAEDAFVAPGATVVGDVTIGAAVGIWYAAVLRADAERIEIGAGSNVQDGSVLHADPGFPAVIGRDVTIGHRAVVHGCIVEDGCLIGMGSVVMNGAVVGAGSLIAAGAVVLEGTRIPPDSLVAGMPAKVRRELTDDERAKLAGTAAHYRELAASHRASLD